MQFTVIRKGTPVSFESSYATNELAIQYLAPRSRSSLFAISLCAKFRSTGRLSDSQWAWVHKIATDLSAPAPAGVNATFSRVVGILNHARQHIKRPKITVVVGNATVRLKRVGPGCSRPEGTVHVTDEKPFGENTYYGRIDPDGTFHGGRDLTDEIRTTLEKLAEDPEKFAREYGKLTGACCFCHSGLKDERSLAVGYGPVCARHFGLSWGEQRLTTADLVTAA